MATLVSVSSSKQSIIKLNIRGLYPRTNQSKVKYLNDIAELYNCFIIAATETHLIEEIEDS